jgi:hypothetical protein
MEPDKTLADAAVEPIDGEVTVGDAPEDRQVDVSTELSPDDAAEMHIEELDDPDDGADDDEPAPKKVAAAPKTSRDSKKIPDNILAADQAEMDNYKETDVFAWANNLVQYKDELKIELFFFNKNNVVYRTNMTAELSKQLEPLFIDEILEYMLEGSENGLIVRGFEDAEAEENVLMRTRLYKVEKAKEMLNWLKTQEHEIEVFKEEEHDIKRIKGIVARCSHRNMPMKFYVIKQLPQSQVMKGSTGWMIRDNKFVQFDADAALRVPSDNQLLVLDQDMYVFSQAKLKALFGYDAKEASIAEVKVREIEENFKLSFADGENVQSMIKGNRGIIKKLQKLEPSAVKQEDIIDRSDELDIGLMQDDSGSIIIMDSKDMTKFVNLLNDDYMESPMTGIRYEIQKKRELKPTEEDENAGILRELS